MRFNTLQMLTIVSMVLIIYASISITYTLAQNQTDDDRTTEYTNTMNDIFGEIIVLAIAVGNFIYTRFIAGRSDEANFAMFKSGLGLLQLFKDNQSTIHQSNAMTFKIAETIDPKIFDKVTEYFPLAKLKVTAEKNKALSQKIIALISILDELSGNNRLSAKESQKIKNEITSLVKEEQEININNGSEATTNVTQ